MLVEVSPRDDLSEVIYRILGDGIPHVDAFTDLPNWSWRDCCNDKQTIVELIRGPLVAFIESRQEGERVRIKRALQYLLNVDKDVPYLAGKFRTFPELQEKVGGITSRAFASYQDTNCPYDSYALCEWIWALLYGSESWHTDISGWVAVNESAIKMEPPEVDSESTSKSKVGFLSSLFGKR